jgi:camphor 5-monooxygenase
MNAYAPVGAERPAHVPEHLVVDFDVYDPERRADAYHAAFVDFQAATPHPLVWSERNGGHWIAVPGQVVLDVFADHGRFSSRNFFVPPEPNPPFMGAMRLDPPHHGPFRIFLNTGLSPKVIRAREAKIREMAAGLIDGFIADGGCDFIEAFADVLPLTVFLELVEIPTGDRAMLSKIASVAARNPDPAARAEASRRLRDYVEPLIAERRANPGEDLLSQIATTEIDGRPITTEEALGAATHVVGAGLDTVASLLGFVMLHLARNPDQRRVLSAEPKRIPAAAAELIRRFPLVVVAREIREDCTYLGTELRRGEMVAIPTQFYNLDPSIYADPLAVDWDREVKTVCTFGHGPHRCPGAVLGRSELIIVLEEWLKRIPEFEVEPGFEAPVQGGLVAKVLTLPLRWAAQL